MLLFIAIVIIIFSPCCLAKKVPICTAVQYSGFLTDCATHNNITSYSYTVKQNTTYLNILIFDFLKLDGSLIDYSTFKFVLDKHVAYYFDSINRGYLLFPNGRATYGFTFRTYQTDSTIEVFYNDGTIFDGIEGLFFNDFDNSCKSQQSLTCGITPFLHTETVCCTHYDYVSVPDISEDTCESFQSTIGIGINDLRAFIIDYDVINGMSLNMTVTPIDPILTYDNYVFGPLNEYGPLYNNTYCNGNYSNPNSTCQVNFPNQNKDFQYEMLFSVTFLADGSYHRYKGVIVGELIRRGGIYYKNINESFTPKNPCWSRNYNVDENSNDEIETSFCCKKFKSGTAPSTTATTAISSSRQTPSLTTTPSKPSTVSSTSLATVPTKPQTSSMSSMTPTSSPTTDPGSNLIGSPCSNDTSQAWLDIVFVIDTSDAMTRRDLNELSGQIATFMKAFTFGQTRNHTIRAGILGYATEVTTFYQLNDTTNYHDFTEKLFAFAAQTSLDDDGGNLQGALQQAYYLLQSQKSFRIPLIILIAAAYDSTGFQGAYHTANVIKNDDITIAVINFAAADGVLTNALQNISSPGYYYISDQDQLYSKLPDALTQINCVCPPNFLQFRVYNSSTKTFTNYADCLYGFDGFTSPDNAERVCRPGTLVAVTSQEKLDFITDRIIPYSLKGQKNFTIGLHKSSVDGEWKWWGYNQTEYPLGDYPSMSGVVPSADDNYGYMWNYQGFNWKLQTGNNVPLPYICQARACDAEYICDLKQTKKEI